MLVAALVYFEDGTTAAQVKTILTKLKVQLDRDLRNDTYIDHAVVNEYDPSMGGPVWYIP